MYAGPTKAITRPVLNNITFKLGNDELMIVKQFRYLIHVTTADCRDQKDIGKQFRKQNAVGNILVR